MTCTAAVSAMMAAYTGGPARVPHAQRPDAPQRRAGGTAPGGWVGVCEARCGYNNKSMQIAGLRTGNMTI